MSLEMSHQALDLTIRQLEFNIRQHEHQTALKKNKTLSTMILVGLDPVMKEHVLTWSKIVALCVSHYRYC